MRAFVATLLLALAAIGARGALRELLPGPPVGADPSVVSMWLEGMQAWRAITLKALHYNGSVYEDKQLKWTQWNYVQAQVMLHERTLLDGDDFTVDTYLHDLGTRYGGLRSVLLWATYPNMGIDNRNQYDLTRAMGNRLKAAVARFNKRGVHVLFPYNPWDQGTRDEGVPDNVALLQVLREFGAEGFFGDTMIGTNASFFEAGAPLAVEPEEFIVMDQLWRTKFGWGYWQNDSTGEYDYVPGVDQMRFVEQRHVTHVCDRWSRNKTLQIQLAFFNGAGVVTWENGIRPALSSHAIVDRVRQGIFNQLTDRDAELVRRVATLQRGLTAYTSDGAWTPHSQDIVPGSASGLFASRWDLRGSTLWTVINREATDATFALASAAGRTCFDCYRGVPLDAKRVPIGGGDVTCVVCDCTNEHLPELLHLMQEMTATPLSNYSARFHVALQEMVPIARATATDASMVKLAAVSGYAFVVQGVEIEGGNQTGVDVQYPWEPVPTRFHSHVMNVPAFAVDRFPATNADWLEFQQHTHYVPRDAYNYLRDWANGTSYPEGWDRKPVTWISLDDARSYCDFRGKRLLNEWEFARIVSAGHEGRMFPWGNAQNASCVPTPVKGRTMPGPDNVDAHPCGASADGVYDLVGNTYCWLNEFRDAHTRAAVLRGWAYYAPAGPQSWYWRAPVTNDRHAKYLLAAPALDRSGVIGVRCAADTS